MKTYYSGNSMSAIVGRHKVTRAAVSKRCVELTERLDLLPNRAMRSLTARKAYRDAQPNGICKKLRMGFHKSGRAEASSDIGNNWKRMRNGKSEWRR